MWRLNGSNSTRLIIRAGIIRLFLRFQPPFVLDHVVRHQRHRTKLRTLHLFQVAVDGLNHFLPIDRRHIRHPLALRL